MTAPLKVDDRTNQLVTEGAHFLKMTKKQFVTEAVELYAEQRRVEIERRVKESLSTFDGSRAAAVEIMSGLSPKRIEELGGLG